MFSSTKPTANFVASTEILADKIFLSRFESDVGQLLILDDY